jgi:5S rRNA maturation endonuclease (ribonuclease M5)
MRSKYVPYNDPETGKPMMKNGIPVMLQVASGDSEYIQDLEKQYSLLFGRQPTPQDAKQMWSYVGLIQLANKFLQPEQRQAVADAFVEMLFGPGSQGLYKGDPKRDQEEKMVALNTLVKGLQGINGQGVLSKAQADSKDYYAKYKVIDESLNEAEVKAQLRKGMPHLRDLKPADLLDLIDEIHDGNGNFKLQNIPLNVKVDGFGGRFGKNAEGKPFMGTSRTEPRYEAGFAAYHQKKGTTDPEILGRAQLFDKLFEEMMKAVKMVDSKLGPDFLVNKQVTCEVLFLPFATRTDSGRLKFVGIEYDELPKGVDLALVPFRVVDAESGEDLPNSDKVIKALTGLGKQGSVMFIDNSLTQNEALDVTAIVPPLENIEQIKSLLASGKLAGKREAKEVLAPVALALEKAIINDPNIVGKDMLGKDYEGIVLNTRLGPVKVTSQEQKDVIAAKNAAKQSARTERPRGEAKTAVVAVGSFVGHVGHEQLFDYTVKKAKAVGGDPYLFMGNAVGKDDPIPVQTKLETWHKLYPEYADNISAVTQQGGTLMQKIKHELINPLPGKPPRYDNVIIMVGEDQAGMNIAQALMKAVNKFQGYEHVKVSLEATPRGTGMSFTKLRNILKDPNATEQEQFALWANAFDVKKLGADWIKHLMDVTRKGMGIQNATAPKQKAGRVLNT